MVIHEAVVIQESKAHLICKQEYTWDEGRGWGMWTDAVQNVDHIVPVLKRNFFRDCISLKSLETYYNRLFLFHMTSLSRDV